MVGLVSLTMASCSSSAPLPGEAGIADPGNIALEEISEFQKSAISDGEITRDEYEVGFDNYRNCMERIGYPLSGVSELHLRFDYSYAAAADEQGAIECYFGEFSEIDAGWTLRPEVVENTETSRIIQQCLIDNGIEPAATHAERLEQFTSENLSVERCQDSP